jgi:cytochrome c553
LNGAHRGEDGSPHHVAGLGPFLDLHISISTPRWGQAGRTFMVKFPHDTRTRHGSGLPLTAALGLGAALIILQPAAAQPAADVSVIASTCANCHGPDGRSPGPIPSIAGRPESALRAQLTAFRSETPPPGTTIMNRLAKGYSDNEVAALAKYFSQVSAKAPATAKRTKR